LVVAQFRAMSLLFPCCRSADESGIKKAAGICAPRPTGLKMHSYEKRSTASPGASKTEPNIRHGEVASVVPCEEHAACCETTTASRENSPRKTANEKQGGTIYLIAQPAERRWCSGTSILGRACRCILPSCARCG